MPYASNDELPPEVRDRYSSECQSVFRRVFNDTMEKAGDEGRAFATAHTAAGNCQEAKDHVDGYRVKAGKPLDFTLTEEGEVKVAFATLGTVATASADDIDKDGDVSLVGSMPVGKAIPISAYAHKSWPERGGELPTGRGTIEEHIGPNGKPIAVFTGKFFTETTHGRDTYLTVKALGDLQEWSHGYREVKSRRGEWAGRKANIIEKFDVYEVSPVLIGAGTTATLAIKGDDIDPSGDGLLAGLSYADDTDRVLAVVKAWVERTDELATLRGESRGKAGRVLSAANRERIAKVVAALRDASGFIAELDAMLAETDPDAMHDPFAVGKALEAEFIRTQHHIRDILTTH